MAQTKKRTKKKNKRRTGTVILLSLMVVLIVVAALFIYYLGRMIYTNYVKGGDDSSEITADVITYETTPVSKSTKVGYYVIGLLGDEGVEDETDLLSMVCFDKQQKTLRILQLPRATYLGTDGTFKVKQLSQVFANPQDYVWCDTCRLRVYDPERAEDGTHTVCHTALTSKEGSSTVNLAEVFNQQYGLPVDGYYLFEQDTFRKMIDLIGGVDVELKFNVKMEDTTYQAGLRTIDGAAALKYIRMSPESIDGDIDRFDRFQQICTAVMQRLFVMDNEKLTDDVFQPLMAGSTPIRVAVGVRYKQIVDLVLNLSGVSFDNMKAYVLPGEKAKSEGVEYYSVHTQELLQLLNAEFNPYDDAIAAGDIHATELANSKEADLRETTLSQWVVEQTNVVTTTTATAAQ